MPAADRGKASIRLTGPVLGQVHPSSRGETGSPVAWLQSSSSMDIPDSGGATLALPQLTAECFKAALSQLFGDTKLPLCVLNTRGAGHGLMEL